MKLRKIDYQEAEKRPIFIEPGLHEFGRSKGVVQCPFCGRRNIIYLWSFYGGGKRCMNPRCRAFLGFRWLSATWFRWKAARNEGAE